MTFKCATVAWALCHSWDCVWSWADEWQTMITGCLAVVAAGLALAASTKQARDQRKGKLRAARAELPASLSSVSLFADMSLERLKEAFPASALMYPNNVKGGEDYQLTVNMPSFPQSSLPNLMAIVEYAGDSPVSRQIERIIREVQVFTARTHKLNVSMVLTLPEICGHMIHAASIHALADGLFDFSRGLSRGVDPKPLWEAVKVVLYVHDLDQNPFVMKAFWSQRAAGRSPTEADYPLEL